MTRTGVTAPTTQRLKAIADETRMRILGHLRGGECCVCELMEVLDIAQSRLSFHLKVLKEADLIQDRRESRWSYYVLNREAIEMLGASVAKLSVPAARRTRRRSCS